jgi:hypothetical protein
MKEIKVTSMTEAEIQSATAALVELRRQMTFVLPMTAAERQANRKLGRKTVQVTQMRAAAAREHKDSLPPSFDLRAFERQVALLTALDACLQAADQVRDDLRDTFLIIGSGALQTSKVAYGHIQVVADAGGDMNRVVKHLKLRVNKPKRVATPTGPPAGSANAAGPTAQPAPPAQPEAQSSKPSSAATSNGGRGPTEKAA